jgi:hypothetical protein
MPNRFSDTLFQLVHTLEKAEKRHFKLYIKRSSSKEDLKIIQLFDALDKMQDYDEAVLLKKLTEGSKTKLANLKTHLYKELLASLRLLKTTDNVDLQLSEHLDNARILYNKGLKQQSLRIIERAKELARANHKYNSLVQLISLEKKIETLHITRSTTDKTERLAEEALAISSHVDRVTRFSNLALLLYRWFVINGHARNEDDEKDIKAFFKSYLPKDMERVNGFYEKLYLYQSYCWYAFIRQDFLMYYRYSQKWVDLYDEDLLLKSIETGHYIKGMHTLLNAHFDLRNFRKFDEAIAQFERYAKTDVAKEHDNFRTHTSIYINSAKLNGHLMKGTFKEGIVLVKEIEEKLQEYALYVDQHRILVFNYKFASVYFGNGDYNTAIDYLHRIINESIDLRIDLQCYARLMHLLCHYELGNYEILESLSKSVHRYMAKMKNLTVVEEAIIRFLKTNFKAPDQIRESLKKLLDQIKHLERNRFETRSFAYLDIISWLESKVYNKTTQEVVYGKYMKSKKR